MKTEIKAYLDRIGFKGKIKNNFETLRRLQSRHLMTVPYENLDIMRGTPLSLKMEDVYEKIVVRRRGGYCFEINGLFAWLLRELGFGVKEYKGRFFTGWDGLGEVPMRRHRVLKVTCNEGDYLSDAGVGLIIPRIPLPMIPGHVSEQGADRFKLEKEPILGYVLYEWKKDKWLKMYSFTEEEQYNIDYEAISFYCENHPGSFFRSKDMVHVFTDDGRKTVDGRELKIFSKSGVEVIVPGSDEIYMQLLEKHFGIRL